MATLENSRRSFNQATYTPLAIDSEKKPKAAIQAGVNAEPKQLEVDQAKEVHSNDAKPQMLQRTWEKASFVASLNLTLSEVSELMEGSSEGSEIRKFLESLKDMIPESGRMHFLRNVKKFNEVSSDTVCQLGELIAKFRREKVKKAIEMIDKIAEDENETITADKPEKGKPIEVAKPHSPLDKLKRLVTPGSEYQVVVKWVNKIAETSSISPVSFDALKTVLQKIAGTTEAATEGFKLRMTVQPVGLLHLEKLSFTPQAIERGELLYSMALAPKEEINVIHKEWSNTTVEFERIEQSFEEEYSEEGVSEKSELSEATNSQQQHSDTLNASVNVSGSYGPTSVSASASAGVSNSDSSSRQSSVKNSSEFTSKASSRSKKEHKVSFKVTSASGVEDQSVRRITNPYKKPVRVDYYQLVRKWKVDLHRYGLRLTYDIVIPEPGADILTKIIKLSEINQQLEQPFQINFKPKDITRDNWPQKAEDTGVPLDPPPPEKLTYIQMENKNWGEAKKIMETLALEFDIDSNYLVDTYELEPFVAHKNFWPRGDVDDWWVGWVGGQGFKTQNNDTVDNSVKPPRTDYLKNLSGKFSVYYYAHHMIALSARAIVNAKVKESAYLDWQLKAWNKIKEAKEIEYQLNRQRLQEMKSRLLEELGVDDPLTLRKKEREEVMKGVLLWLIPGFEFWPDEKPSPDEWFKSSYVGNSGVSTDTKGNSLVLRDEERMFVLEHGEFIKFLHHAIEWENMLYFLYPYFWGHPTQNGGWETKKYLKHPNLLHEVFLKAGSARVVLTVRPGFEKAFLNLMETGDPNAALDKKNPYFSIAEEYEAYAKTNYPGLKPANPETNARPLILPKQQETWERMEIIMDKLKNYNDGTRRYPSNLKDFGTTVHLKDAWGHDFYYKYPGKYKEYDLASWGKDGEKGGDDLEDMDITNWAEANWIGTWFEYMPTSAMDITFGNSGPDNMPEA